MRRVSLLTSNTADSNEDTASAVANSSNHHPNAETMTLSEILALAGVTHHTLKSEDDNNIITNGSIQLDGSNTTNTLNVATDGNKTMKELGLVHGSIITILKSSSSSSVSNDNHLGRHSKTNSNDKKKKNEDNERFDPFPELATSSSSSRTTSIMSRRSRREKAMKQNKRLHIIEPQSTCTTTDVVKRVYVCERSAAKFRNHCIISTATKKRKAATTATTATSTMENRVGLLFGTIESSSNNVANNGIINGCRKTMGKRRTSISESDKYCPVVELD
jgi:hypothetical protein